MEELGRTLAASPMLATAVVGASCLLLGGSEQQRQEWLPRIGRGECLLALAFEEQRHFAPYRIAAQATSTQRGYRLSGSKTFVLDGHVADRLIVTARTASAPGERLGITLFLVDSTSPGVHVTRTLTLDSRNAAKVELHDVDVPGTAMLGTPGGGADILDRVLHRATAALAAEMLGTMSAAFDMTIDYLKLRTQFGVPIGSFQALKHRTATMFVEIELARSLVRDALQALDDDRGDAAVAVSAAKAHVGRTLMLVANEAIQMHGGIGMTDDHDVGFYLKRARVAQFTLGDARYHCDYFARLRGF